MRNFVSDRSPLALASAAAVGVLAVVPLTGDYAAFVGSLAVVLGLVALGFVVLTGWGGDVSLGQVVPYGLGAYATYWMTVQGGIPVALSIVLGALLTAPLVALVGVPALRLRGLDLAVGTLALGLVFQLMVFRNLGRWLGPSVTSLTQFSSTVVRVPRPHLGPLSLTGNRSFYVAALVLGVLVLAAVVALGRSPLSRTLKAVRDDPVRAEALGVPVARYRLLAFVVAGVLTALAGGVFASLRGAVTPESFTIFESLNLLAVAAIGGLATPGGAVLAGIFGAALPELARVAGFRFLQGRLTLVYGAGLVAVLAWQPGGLAALAGWVRRRPTRLPKPGPPAPRARLREGSALLRVDDLSVAFGGVRAVDGVTLRVAEGERVAVIGPNGAGKSTLFQMVDGLLAPDAGRVFFAGSDITEWPAHRRAEAGLGRTFQTVRAFAGLTVAEHLVVAASRSSDPAAAAADVLRRLQLEAHADDLPDALPYGTLRTLEVGMALAARPRLLLLDEPTAGMAASDADRLCDLLAELHDEQALTLLLVEHDMAVVGRLARRVVVLDRGHVIADGDPAAVASDPVVVASYLGTTPDALRRSPAPRPKTTKATKKKKKRLAGARR